MSKLPMTAAGHVILEDELNQRIRIERSRLIAAVVVVAIVAGVHSLAGQWREQ
jgi:hypothetical protein